MSLDEVIGQLEKVVADIRRVSFSDDKTPLGNALALAQEERRINEGISEFNVVVFGDLNDFKNLNDEYGHEAGDVAIQQAGVVISLFVVESLQAKAFRQSGDEFVILLKQDSVESFLAIAPSFGDIHFSYNEKELVVKMSLGYARSDKKASFDDLLKRAEIACQRAKVQDDGVCIEWTEDIEVNKLVRRGGRCRNCAARITCNVPERTAPAELILCPCCGGSL